MTAKQVNNCIKALMWIVYLGLMALICIVSARHMVVRKYYEPIPGGATEQSVYTDEYGQQHPSTVSLYYRHKHFARPEPVFYDKNNDQEYGIKDAYYQEVVSGIPASEKPHLWQHCFWLWIIVVAIGLGYLMYNLTLLISREAVFSHIRRKPDYADCGYYLNDSDFNSKHREEVQKLMVVAHADYLRGLKLSYPKSFGENELLLKEVKMAVENIINYTARTGSNQIPVDVYFTKSFVDYDIYRQRELSKLDAGDYDATLTEERKVDLRKLWKEELTHFYHRLTTVKIDPANHLKPACMIFDRMFEHLLKEKVFDCQGQLRRDYDKAREIEELESSGNGFKLSVICDFQNASGYLSFSDEVNNYPNMIVFVQAILTVLYPDGKYSTWTFKRYTDNSKFTYSKENGTTVNIDDLYSSMINSGLYGINL